MMKKNIPTQQVTFSILVFITASSLLTKNIYMDLVQDAWAGVLLGGIFALVAVWMYSTLAGRFPGLSIGLINEAVFGRAIGKVFTALYLPYVFSLCYLNTWDFGTFVNAIILPDTPMAIIMVMIIILCAMAVRKGMNTITAFSFIFMVLVIVTIVTNFILLYKNTELKNFLPVFTKPVWKYFKGAHMIAAIPLCESLVFFTLAPQMKNPAELGKALRNGIFMGVIMLLLIVIRDIAVLGDYVTVSALPAFSVIRLIDVGDFLNRLDIIYASMLITLLFFKLSILYYAGVSALEGLLEFKPEGGLVSVFGALVVAVSIGVFQSPEENRKWISTAAPTYATFFLFLLPALTLAVAMLRGARSGEAKPSLNTGSDGQGGEK